MVRLSLLTTALLGLWTVASLIEVTDALKEAPTSLVIGKREWRERGGEKGGEANNILTLPCPSMRMILLLPRPYRSQEARELQAPRH